MRQNINLSLVLTLLGFSIGFVVLAIEAGPDVDPRTLNIEALAVYSVALGFTLFAILFLVDALALAGLQLFILSPAIVIVCSFYFLVSAGKFFMRMGWLPVKRLLMVYGCVYSIYHLPWLIASPK